MKTGWLDSVAAARLVEEGTDAFRVFDTGRVRVERFGDSALISAPERAEIDELCEALEQWAVAAGWDVQRLFGRLLVRGPGVADVPFLVRGEAALPLIEVVRENGLAYEIDFSASYSPGLFVDQRENRKRLRELAPRTLLNTFSYTCAFSVAGAMAGAKSTSVDVSKAALARGRRNFALNHLDATGHRFVPEDVPVYLERLLRRGEQFEAVVLDPPTFGRSGGRKTFRIERDLPDLVGLAAALVVPGGSLLVSTNFREWSVRDLLGLCRRVLPEGARLEPGPSQVDIVEGAITLWANL